MRRAAAAARTAVSAPPAPPTRAPAAPRQPPHPRTAARTAAESRDADPRRPATDTVRETERARLPSIPPAKRLKTGMHLKLNFDLKSLTHLSHTRYKSAHSKSNFHAELDACRCVRTIAPSSLSRARHASGHWSRSSACRGVGRAWAAEAAAAVATRRSPPLLAAGAQLQLAAPLAAPQTARMARAAESCPLCLRSPFAARWRPARMPAVGGGLRAASHSGGRGREARAQATGQAPSRRWRWRRWRWRRRRRARRRRASLVCGGSWRVG